MGEEATQVVVLKLAGSSHAAWSISGTQLLSIVCNARCILNALRHQQKAALSVSAVCLPNHQAGDPSHSQERLSVSGLKLGRTGSGD